jgi:hypothetical protein
MVSFREYPGAPLLQFDQAEDIEHLEPLKAALLSPEKNFSWKEKLYFLDKSFMEERQGKISTFLPKPGECVASQELP